jgi:hypothetical protein
MKAKLIGWTVMWDARSSSPGAALPMDWATYVVTMIPPEQVERNHALLRDNPGLVFC